MLAPLNSGKRLASAYRKGACIVRSDFSKSKTLKKEKRDILAEQFAERNNNVDGLI